MFYMHTRYFFDGSAGKESACNAGFHLWVGTIPWSRKYQPIPVFRPEISHGQRTWRATIQRVSKSRTQLSD